MKLTFGKWGSVMKKQLPLVIVLGLILVAAGITGWAIWSGNLFVSLKDPGQTVAMRTSVCSDEIVEIYNKAVTADTYEAYTENLKTAFARVDALQGNNNDPTCVFIKYRYYVSQGQSDKVKEAAARLEELINDGDYPSVKLADIESLEVIKGRASTAGAEENEAGGNG